LLSPFFETAPRHADLTGEGPFLLFSSTGRRLPATNSFFFFRGDTELPLSSLPHSLGIGRKSLSPFANKRSRSPFFSFLSGARCLASPGPTPSKHSRSVSLSSLLEDSPPPFFLRQRPEPMAQISFFFLPQNTLSLPPPRNDRLLQPFQRDRCSFLPLSLPPARIVVLSLFPLVRRLPAQSRAFRHGFFFFFSWDEVPPSLFDQRSISCEKTLPKKKRLSFSSLPPKNESVPLSLPSNSNLGPRISSISVSSGFPAFFSFPPSDKERIGFFPPSFPSRHGRLPPLQHPVGKTTTLPPFLPRRLRFSPFFSSLPDSTYQSSRQWHRLPFSFSLPFFRNLPLGNLPFDQKKKLPRRPCPACSNFPFLLLAKAASFLFGQRSTWKLAAFFPPLQ